jgi:hypothetical protein
MFSGRYTRDTSISYKIRCAVERLEESLVRLTEVALVTECSFVDSPGSVREVFESSLVSRSDRHFFSACSKIAPSVSKVFLGGGSIVTLPRSHKTARSRCRTAQARNRDCFDASNSSRSSWIASGVALISIKCSHEHLS